MPWQDIILMLQAEMLAQAKGCTLAGDVAAACAAAFWACTPVARHPAVRHARARVARLLKRLEIDAIAQGCTRSHGTF